MLHFSNIPLPPLLPITPSTITAFFLLILSTGSLTSVEWRLLGRGTPRDACLPLLHLHLQLSDATTLDATTLDATTPDATTLDATTPDATTLDATTPDATATTLDATTLQLH